MSKGRILCIEDDQDTREMLRLLLEHFGYEVITPDKAEQALSIALKGRFDLLLCDNWMPGMSGVDLTREVRKTNSRTPIVFYSGAASASDIEEALKAGAQAYLVKPVDIDRLLSEIQKLIPK